MPEHEGIFFAWTYGALGSLLPRRDVANRVHYIAQPVFTRPPPQLRLRI